ncbi:DNA-binding transcriptional LysR family regulator [Oceanisphaera litoralis]|uniref:LysR family transcriptional regulator n=1 Tax=Oceanisphaera litoralis TaxID=225144 RepID=UPI00195B7303|nr:LysR family transcriptional regulator [Oceanisphaera litoralis]MBM7454947.1 DNA-binding transcriptional LysR family regulator [Oceanisphaera litoralis]
MVNPVWLRSFCTLVEVGHFTRTAERLHMTQSGVSQHVRKLEAHFGVTLLVRQGKGFTLTDAGERLYTRAGDILQSLSGLEQHVGQDPAFEGLVRVMSPGSVGLKLYPQLLGLQRRHPGLVIDYRFAPNASVEQAVANNSTDMGLMTQPSALEAVRCRAIAREALLLVTPAAVSKPDWPALLALGFINHPDCAHHAGLLLSANFAEFEHVGQFQHSGFSNQIGLILAPVSLGLGFTVLPAHAVAAFPQPESIRAHALPRPVSETIYVATHRHRPVANRVGTVMKMAKAQLDSG